MYVKLFSSILTSSVWAEDAKTRIVWITLLALADREGDVQSSPSGLARLANVTLKDCHSALTRFCAPDTESGTQEYAGRRIEEHEGGWHILNYTKYRAMQDEETRKAQWRESSRTYRQRKSAPHQQKSAHTDTDTDTEGGKALTAPTTKAERTGRDMARTAAPLSPAHHALLTLRQAVWTAGQDGRRDLNWQTVPAAIRARCRVAWLASGWSVEEFDEGKDFGNSKRFCAAYNTETP